MALHLAPHTISDVVPVQANGLSFNSSDARSFTSATDTGWTVYQTAPLLKLSQNRRDRQSGSVRNVLQLEQSNILFIVGGGPQPLYPPNKVIVWDDKLGKQVAQLEFREQVRQIAARRDRLIVVLSKRVVVFALAKGATGIWREGSYETTINLKGLVAVATTTGSTLLAFPGRQAGQVQLVTLPPLDRTSGPLPPPPSYDPTRAPFPTVSIIIAHTSHLSALTTTPDGALVATTSSKGTLVRVWDATTGSLVKELRRGTDYADIFGLSLRQDGNAVAVTSDKGTVHAWDLTTTKQDKRKSDGEAYESSRHKQLDMLKPFLPKYFSSEWSHSQFRLPASGPSPSKLPNFAAFASPSPSSTGTTDERTGRGPLRTEDDICICGWIKVGADAQNARSPFVNRSNQRPAQETTRDDDTGDYQIVAITRSGGWFRISLNSDRAGRNDIGSSSVTGMSKRATNECTLEEYRRFGGDEWDW
ncbi:Phosphatidylinositol 3,5-bisphosphate-binding protein [Microbotryomycetes sp. JL221]|nr:Phosphatidylinositol 3,5-bisphosphate-binding protein [Microbotryomycetes sp. JL221]